MPATLTSRFVALSLFCLLAAGGLSAETRYATVFTALPKGDQSVESTVFVTNTLEVQVSIDTFFVNQGTKGTNPTVTTQTLDPGEQAEFQVPGDFKVGYFGIDSDDDLLITANVAVVGVIESSASVDIQEANVISAADAFAAGSMAIIDAQWGVSQVYVQALSASRTTCTADVFDDDGDAVVGGSGLALSVKALGLKRYKTVASLIKTLPTSVSRIEIICDNPFYPQAYFWDSGHRDFSIISPQAEPDPPPPPPPDSIVYGPYSSFVPTFSNPQAVYEFTPPVGDYERFIVKWQITFQGWGPDGGATDNFHGLLVLQWNNYRDGAMGSLTVRGPDRNFIRDVWGFGMTHPGKNRFQKGFNNFQVGKKYDLCYIFDLVAEMITIEIRNEAGNVIFSLTSPAGEGPGGPNQKSPKLFGSIHRGNADVFRIKLGDHGDEPSKSKSIGWRYKLNSFELFPVPPP